MAKTFRYIALSLLLLIWSYGQAKDTKMTTIDLTTTSGTMMMRRVEATSFMLTQDAQQAIAEDLHMVSRMNEKGDFLDATASKGLVNLSGNKLYAEQFFEEMDQRETLEVYGERFSDLCYPKDVLLGGDGAITTIILGDSGKIKTETIIWSELLQWYLIPGKFDQSMTLEDGSLITVTGMSAVIEMDEDSQNWSYYGDETQQVEMIFTNPDPAQ